MDLTQAKFGQSYIVSRVVADEPLKSRLFSFGFAKGSTVSLIEYTLTKQTYDVQIEDSKVALRSEEAKGVILEEHK